MEHSPNKRHFSFTESHLRSADPLGWELRIDWNHFDLLGEVPVDLDKVELILRHQPPTAEYGAKGRGTIICCYGGRQRRRLFRRLRQGRIRLGVQDAWRPLSAQVRRRRDDRLGGVRRRQREAGRWLRPELHR